MLVYVHKIRSLIVPYKLEIFRSFHRFLKTIYQFAQSPQIPWSILFLSKKLIAIMKGSFRIQYVIQRRYRNREVPVSIKRRRQCSIRLTAVLYERNKQMAYPLSDWALIYGASYLWKAVNDKDVLGGLCEP